MVNLRYLVKEAHDQGAQGTLVVLTPAPAPDDPPAPRSNSNQSLLFPPDQRALAEPWLLAIGKTVILTVGDPQ